MDVKKDLIELRNTLFDFSRRNPFVHIQKERLWCVAENENTSLPERLFRKANYYFKEYGLATTLEVFVFIKWLPPIRSKSTENNFFTSPLFYRPCKIKRVRKITTSYILEEEEESYLVNPVLRYYFKYYFDLELPEMVDDLMVAKQILVKHFSDEKSVETLKEVVELDTIEEWQIITKRTVGNFNYKKSLLAADYDTIIEQPNKQILQLLSHETQQEKAIIEKPNQFISFLDQSQKNVISKALVGDLLIQGPPGTGKSHTIVALIGSYLLEGKKVLFVSEKRSALEVVQERLAEKGLGNIIAYFNTNKDQKKTFYTALKKSWEVLNDTHITTPNTVTNIVTSGGLFHFYPDKLNQRIPAINSTLSDLISIVLKAKLSIKELKINGKAPSFGDWNENYSFLELFEKQMQEAFKVDFISECHFSALNSVVFGEEQVVFKLEKRLVDLSKTIEKINTLQLKFNWNESFNQFVKLALTASILSMVDNVQIDLLNVESKKYKSFNNWAKKYQLLKKRVDQIVHANQKWTKKPSIGEITELMDLLKTAENKIQRKNIFSRMRRSPARLNDAFRDFHSGISNYTKIKLLESVKMEWRLKAEFEEIELKLRHNFNVKNPDHEIDLIFNLRNKLDAVSQNEYLKILEHENSSQLVKELSLIHPDIVKFNGQKRFLFQDYDIDSLHEFESNIQKIKNDLPIINHWLPELKHYFELKNETLNIIKGNKKKIYDLHASIAYQNVLDHTRFETDFKRLSGWELIQDAIRLNKANTESQASNINCIIEKAKTEQLYAEQLLTKPGFKLKGNKKEEKKAYKKSKRLILHEVNKQQRHLSVRDFFGETKNHLMKIQPVWIMNPITVSEFLPCQADLFDVVIFDESSQIPIEDTIPAIYRTKQIIVVGDSKQMPPSAFFSSREETKTILDQAEQVFPKEMLKWHYRSTHPDLIRFSNNEFYNGELLTFPPKTENFAIELNSVNGVYDTGKNRIEAEKIAQYCFQLLKTDKRSLLILAFSQEQEREIQNQLNKIGLENHLQIETRNLENSQGIEADIVIISIGYGWNKDGKFRLNFGPVNQSNGANRLNVLFTRAKEKMILFTSVKSSDFGLSENNGVQVLKDFLQYCEQANKATNTPFEKPYSYQLVEKIIENNHLECVFYPKINGIGFSSFINHSRNRILLVDPGINENDSEDILSLLGQLYTVYSEVMIVLSIDLWLNPDRVEADLLVFFNKKQVGELV